MVELSLQILQQQEYSDEVEELIGENHHEKVHHTKPDGTCYPKEKCSIYAAYKDKTIYAGTDEVFWKKDGTSLPIEYVSTPNT